MSKKRNPPTAGQKPPRDLASLEILSNGLSLQEKAVFREVWISAQSITCPEVRQRLGADRGCSTRLRDLELRGMVAHGPRRVCTVSKKMCNTWQPTGSGVKPLIKSQSDNGSVDMPTAHEIRLYVQDITVLTGIAYSKGARLSPAIRKVSNWLRAGAPGLITPNGRRAKRQAKNV